MKIKILAAFLFLCLPNSFVFSLEIPETIIKVAVLENVSNLNVESEKKFFIYDLIRGVKKNLEKQTFCQISANKKGLFVGSEEWSDLIRIVPEEDDFIIVNGKKYRDTIILKKTDQEKITVINELGLDHYLYGILPKEVSWDWPKESLKAQAVISRTFALKNLKRHESEGFHFCSKVHCQVYGGLNSEKETTNQAVDETDHEILTYRGELINSVFFANCGGQTEQVSNTWLTNIIYPYLKSVRCRFCGNEPNYFWKRLVTESEIVESLKKNRYEISLPLRSIRNAGYGRSGRAKFLKISHGAGILNIRASQFRMSLGPDRIRSTLFKEIKKVKKGFIFRGKGWGHGIGMCQDGAKGLARKGTSYKKILHFYYSGSKIEKLEY
ncbi:MAG: hypothetical protein A3I11_04550 [Elusimicrobia bacterium RIFCSPLOWO2_02_FULL_39_32]|nr:MAG: hypothetical protein A2034_06685 [Elusimicrobia bacterium GWA2_38_7]OGR79635.1 MAG: hypothetical protein A3B80_03120 [Elusimicrobia bacterium RIFCSPHIGHO2_02_FULL_39_36]OGR92962.1 MAG: hypothetical protein A3I11_04550 [Elusimicrobia bacterium RIFCSPLOWO2_02_FULL_39_32]OGR99745.1 MAG: hypothetical protein A3G85_01910 [Elusimicrobia bacterium RIFCSPLOWO2_12_FULL_39_28]